MKRIGSTPIVTGNLAVVNARSRQLEFKCGHHHALLFDLDLFGQIYTRQAECMRRKELCGKCTVEHIRRYFRRCSCCGRVIMPDDAVSFSATGVTPYCDEPWNGKVAHDGHDLGFIACVDPVCMANVRQMAGYWRDTGFEPRLLGDSGLIDTRQWSSFVRTG